MRSEGGRGGCQDHMNRTASDEEVMALVREGSIESLATLFDRHHVALFNFFCRLGDGRMSSEDLVQEVFYRILKYRRTYRPGSTFRGWMYTIARNARFDFRRARHGATELDESAIPATYPRDDVQAEEDRSMLERALQRLPADKREVLVLARYQEMKYEEIASILNCEVGAVKVRVHRALRELKDHFRQLEGQPDAKCRPEPG